MAEIAVALSTPKAEGLASKLVDKLHDTISGELSLLLGARRTRDHECIHQRSRREARLQVGSESSVKQVKH